MERSALSEVFEKFRVHYYKDVFNRIQSRELSLTTVEAYCVETIHSLGCPTINEFANFIGISSPNAIKKGYVEKVQSATDKREYHLKVTDRYYKYWNLSEKYFNIVEGRMKEALTDEEYEFFTRIMQKVSDELMPEMSH